MTRFYLAAALVLSPIAAHAVPIPGTIAINDADPVRVTSVPALRRILARCTRAGACTSVTLETCDRCTLSAEAARGGYRLTTRTGPPGPEFDLFDRRPGHRRTHIFTPADMIAVMTAYLAGRDTAWTGQVRNGQQF